MSVNASTMVAFRDKNSYNLKDEIKKCKGTFDINNKVWMVPQGALSYLKELSDNMEKSNKDRTAIVWKKACSALGHRFVKKGTSEYDEVLLKFKELIKEVPEEKDEEEYNEDDVVYD